MKMLITGGWFSVLPTLPTLEMAFTTHLWWNWGWFLILLRTLQSKLCHKKRKFIVLPTSPQKSKIIKILPKIMPTLPQNSWKIDKKLSTQLPERLDPRCHHFLQQAGHLPLGTQALGTGARLGTLQALGAEDLTGRADSARCCAMSVGDKPAGWGVPSCQTRKRFFGKCMTHPSRARQT